MYVCTEPARKNAINKNITETNMQYLLKWEKVNVSRNKEMSITTRRGVKL